MGSGNVLSRADSARERRARLGYPVHLAVELCAEWRLRLGETGEVVRELTEFCGEHPTRELSQLLLMRALAKEGRYAEASTLFHGLRRRLADELGSDPGPHLRPKARSGTSGSSPTRG